MSTRLNTSLRQAIVENVVKATNIPSLKDDLKKRVKATARRIILESLPEGFAEQTANLPKEWFRHEHQLDVYLQGDLDVLRKVISTSGYEHYIRLDDPVVCPVGLKLDHKAAQATLLPLAQEAELLFEREAELRCEISAFLASCSTVEKVVERMPELTPHIPKASKPMPLVAPSNLLSNLARLGFDRTVQASAEA